MKNIYLSTSWHLKMLSTRRIYTSVLVFKKCLNEEYLPLWKCTKMLFSTLKNFSTRRTYSSVEVFNWRIFTYVRVNWNRVFYTWKGFLLEKFTPQCKRFSYFSMKNIYPCASWLKRCFLHLKMFSTWRIYTSVWVD